MAEPPRRFRGPQITRSPRLRPPQCARSGSGNSLSCILLATGDLSVPLPSQRTWKQYALALATAATVGALTACGGGGAGSPSSTSNPPSPGQHFAVLTWNEATPGTTFNVFRGTASGGESTIAINTSPISNATYQDTDVVAGQIYYYTIQAVDANGVSPMSSEISATIPSP